MLLGLVVHWRIYPVIFALPIWLFLPSGGKSRLSISAAASKGEPPPKGSAAQTPSSSTGGKGESQPQSTMWRALNFFSRYEC